MGNSLGVIIPNKEAMEHGLSEGDEVEIEVERRVNLRELFGTGEFTMTAQQIKDEARRGWRE